MDGTPFFTAKGESTRGGSGWVIRRQRHDDIVYLDERGARVWFNESGNGCGTPRIRGFPGVHATTAVETSLARQGHSCLVWSEASDWAEPCRCAGSS